MDKKSINLLLRYSITPLLLCLLVSCGPGEKRLYKETRASMYTIVEITVSSDSQQKAKTAIDNAFGELERLAKLLNFYAEDSEISAVNRNAGNKPVRVSPETVEIIEKALYVSENTGGAFDITVGPLVRLWDFQKKIIPDRAIVKEKLKLVGYKHIVIDKEASTVFLKTKGIQIDLGGIIKGFAADKAVEILKQQGIKAGIVAIAGDIKTFGIRPDGGLWKVGIQNPRQQTDKDEITATIAMTDMAISTSGDYERYFIIDGKRYHHILNPKTGYPADECRSVSIIAKDGSITDPFSTGIFILGAEKGIKLLEEMGIDGIIVDKNGKIHTTPNLRGKLEIIGDSQRQKKTN